ncbi:MAG TPA: cytochrome d ubiquinol oxidase subunit II [Geobacterales bacterium]|nr:cytochrome d ubiquinol oxidase subunit II [Geobacterales bacterium]
MDIFQLIWFILWGVLWSVYFMLDGFVLGTGMLHRLVATSDAERRVVINTVGPVWDGNEVWLITAGGATFAAFPTTYALMFSYLYTPLLLLLFALIIRGVSFEFRGKSTNSTWRNAWDWAIVVSSFLIALLFGVAFGNIFKGLPMDAAGYHGSFIALLNPYGLLTGLLFVLLFLLHGALYLSVKSDGQVMARASRLAGKLWLPVLIAAALFLAVTPMATSLEDNYRQLLPLAILPLLAVVGLVLIRFFLGKNLLYRAFALSCLTVVAVVATGVAGLFPNLIPSTLDPLYSLTITNSSSSPYTLRIMTGVAAIFVPIIIAYKIWVYRIFRSRVTVADVEQELHPY